MLNKLFCIVALFFTASVLGQTYEFDTFTEYEYIKTEKGPVYKSFELTNSKDNSYIVSIIEKDDKPAFVIFFLNEKGLKAEVEISKNDFFKAESITIDCGAIKQLGVSKVVDFEGYDFYKLNDTIIRNDTLNHYTYKSNDAKIAKKHGEKHFIIQKKTGYHLPNLTPGTKTYVKWSQDHSRLPNGLTRQSYILVKDRILEKVILLQYTSVKKKLILKEPCN